MTPHKKHFIIVFFNTGIENTRLFYSEVNQLNLQVMPKNSKNKNIFDEIKLLEDYLINLNENKIIIFIKKRVIIYLGN